MMEWKTNNPDLPVPSRQTVNMLDIFRYGKCLEQGSRKIC